MTNFVNMLFTGQQLKRLYDGVMRATPGAESLTRNELDVLLFLANNPGYDTARDITELRGLTKSHVCQSVESLTARGYLSGAQDRRDRRLVHLHVLPPALPVIEAARASQARFMEVLYRGVTEEERAAAEQFFAKIENNVKEALNHGY